MLRADQGILPHDAEFVKFNVVQEHINAAEVVSSQVNLLPEEAALDVFLAQNFFHLQKQGTAATGGIYVPTDFDTIEKAFSGVKTAEKGIKQGLSRSITDSESPFSLYSVVDFCRSKVRRHRGV